MVSTQGTHTTMTKFGRSSDLYQQPGTEHGFKLEGCAFLQGGLAVDVCSTSSKVSHVVQMSPDEVRPHGCLLDLRTYVLRTESHPSVCVPYTQVFATNNLPGPTPYCLRSPAEMAIPKSSFPAIARIIKTALPGANYPLQLLAPSKFLISRRQPACWALVFCLACCTIS